MILDTENIPPLQRTTTVWATPEPSPLDHRVAQLEATVRAQAAELRVIMNMTTVLRLYEGDGR